MASNKKSAKESEEGFKTILAVEAALSPPKEIRGLLDYLEASPADADTLDKRIKSALDLIEAHRQKRFGDLRLEIAKNLPLLPLVGLAPIKPSEDK
jgi:hypothetical protein